MDPISRGTPRQPGASRGIKGTVLAQMALPHKKRYEDPNYGRGVVFGYPYRFVAVLSPGKEGGSGTEPGPETGTVGTAFPETESGTGTAGTVFQEPKPEPEPSFPVK